MMPRMPSPPTPPNRRPGAAPRRRLLPAALLVVCAAVLALTACRPPDGPRELPAPRLDTAAAVRGTTTVDNAAPGSAGDDALSSFERRLRQRQSGTGAGGADGGGDTATVALQRISLGDLMAELPQRRGGWRWGRDDDVTLLVHGGGDGVPDALLLALRRDRTAAPRPALAAHRFYLGVDPSLANRWLGLGSRLAPAATRLAGELPLSPLDTLEALEMLLTPTAGRGIGYRGDPDSFSGWKWTGHNPHGTFLRLARTTGRWGPQGDLPRHAELVLEHLADAAPRLGDLLWQEPGGDSAETPAFLLLGSAERDDGRGLHLAALCRTAPACPVADDLAALLDSLRPPEGAGAVSRTGAAGFREVAFAAGLTLYGDDERPDAAELLRAVEETTAAAGRQAAADEPPATETDGGEDGGEEENGASGSGVGPVGSETAPPPTAEPPPAGAQPAPGEAP